MVMKQNFVILTMNLGRSLKEHTDLLWQPFCSRHGLTQMQLRVLVCLATEGPVCTGNLARKCGLAMGNCSCVCKKMAEAGLVERRRDTRDERVVTLSLTRQGKQVAEQFLAEQDEAVRKLEATLSDEDIRVINQGIDKLNEAMAGQQAPPSQRSME